MTKETSALDNLQHYFSNAESFYNKNKNWVLGITLGIAALIGIGIYLKLYMLPEREAKAQKAMYISQFYFEQDSFKIALNGGSPFKNAMGFKKIIDEYSFTKSANLSKYYAGICELRMGNYAKAIDYLESYSPKDDLLRAETYSLLGDAYSEKGTTDKALNYYAKSTECVDNKLVSPILCLKAAMAHEKFNKKEEALKFYNKIKNEYPSSEQAQQVDKYIYRVSASMN